MIAKFSNFTFLSILKLILTLFLIMLPLYFIYLDVEQCYYIATMPCSLSQADKWGQTVILEASIVKRLKGVLYASGSPATFYSASRNSKKGSGKAYRPENAAGLKSTSALASLENTVKGLEIILSESVIFSEPLKSQIIFEHLRVKEDISKIQVFQSGLPHPPQSGGFGWGGYFISGLSSPSLCACTALLRQPLIGVGGSWHSTTEQSKSFGDKRTYSTVIGSGLNGNIYSQGNDLFTNDARDQEGCDSSQKATEGLELSKQKIRAILERKSLNEILEGLLELNAKEIALLNFIVDENAPNFRTFKYVSSKFKYKIVIQINSRNNLFKDPHYKLVYHMCLYIHSNNKWKLKNRKIWGETHISYNSFKLENSIALGSCSLDDIWENPGDVIIRGVFKESYLKNGKNSLRLNRIVLLVKVDNDKRWVGFFKEDNSLDSLYASHVIINDGPFYIKRGQSDTEPYGDTTKSSAPTSSQTPNACEAMPMPYFIFPSVILQTKMFADLAVLPVLKYKRYLMGSRKNSPILNIINYNPKGIRKSEGLDMGPLKLKGAESKSTIFLQGRGNPAGDKYLATILWINLKHKKPILIFLSHTSAEILTWSPETYKGRDHTIFSFLTALLLHRTLDIGEVFTKSSKITNSFKIIVPRYKEMVEDPSLTEGMKYVYDSAFIKILSKITPYKFEALDWNDPNMPKLIKYVHKQILSNNPSELIQTAIDKCNNKLKKKMKVLNLNIVKRRSPKKKEIKVDKTK